MKLINTNNQARKHYANCRKLVRYEAGFSLIELLVGLVIGLLVSLVIMQVFSVFEGDKRTSMGSADAQTNGNIALYAMSRDLQQAGFGLPNVAGADTPLSCPIADNLTPTIITDGGGNAVPDRIEIRYGTSQSGGMPTKVTDRTGVFVSVTNSMGCEEDDLALQVDGTSCVVKTIKPLTGPNDPNTVVKLHNAAGLTDQGVLYCLGQWQTYTYQVLESPAGSKKYVLTNGTDIIAGDVVNIQAQYGFSNNGDNQIDGWTPATGVWAKAVITPALVRQIKAVRFAVATRNGLKEKTAVTTSQCMTAFGPIACAAAAPNGALKVDISGTAAGAEWQNYRYRVYETTIPIRNMIWAKS